MTSHEQSGATGEGRSDMRPTHAVEPNCMMYKDGDGIERSIYLPQGTLRQASDHLENQRWDELAKFEPYTDQGYKESDYVAYDNGSGEAAGGS